MRATPVAGLAPYAAIVLAGGAGRRLGGPAKPVREVAGRPMRDRVLAAVADASPRVVVGPPDPHLPTGVCRTQEVPAGGGPVAAAAAGLRAIGPPEMPLPSGALAPPETPVPGAPIRAERALGGAPTRADSAPGGVPAPAVLALLAADLPLLDAMAIADLRGVLADDPEVDVAVFVDGAGWRQYLCAVWRTAALAAALAERPPAGRPVRELYAGRRVREVTAAGAGPPPWFDCDTEADLRQAQEWAR